MGRKYKLCRNYLNLILQMWFTGSRIIYFSQTYTFGMFHFHAMLLLWLAFLHPIIRTSGIPCNIMLTEVKCCKKKKKRKLYASDPFLDNHISNCVIISDQFEIFKNMLIPWMSSKRGQYKREMSAFIQTSWAFLQLMQKQLSFMKAESCQQIRVKYFSFLCSLF